jgi:hypothetical protein
MRFILLVTLIFFVSSTALAQTQLDLVSVGESRALPARIMGVSAEPFWYGGFLSDPDKVAAIDSLHPAYTRFPGGSQSNYYDWKSGLFYVTPHARSSSYYAYFVSLAQSVQSTLPAGVTLDQYKPFSDSAGAEVIMVPNLETSSIQDQVEWFQHLASEDAVPTHIELGNEFWVAMGMDPVVLRRWPDEPGSMKVMKQYLDAFSQYLPKGVKVAIQAAAPLFDGEPYQHTALLNRCRQWNSNLHPQSWFDAVTIHLYPRLDEVVGPGAAQDPITPGIAVRNLSALMARIDEGADAQLDDIAQRLPGKEIWVTEWNPKGAEAAGQKDSAQTTTPAMMLQLVTRGALVYLRHPEVAVSQFFEVQFAIDNADCMFIKGADGYLPLPHAQTLTWLNEAANGGATYQRFYEAGNPLIPGAGVRQESYGAIEAALLRGNGRTTLILQNASDNARVWDVSQDLQLGAPSLVEQMSMPDLADSTKNAAQVNTLSTSIDIQVPPYSVTRVVWDGN